MAFVSDQGEVRHESATVNMDVADRRSEPVVLSEEQKHEYGYPTYPKEFDDPKWMKRQLALEEVDPRVNPNLLLSKSDPEYAANAARKPYAKAMIKAEEHWQMRKNTWQQQHRTVEEANREREEIAKELEHCSTELKRLIQPLLKYRVVELNLQLSFREARAKKIPFAQLLEARGTAKQIMTYRKEIEAGGDAAAERLFEQLNGHYMIVHAFVQKKSLEAAKAAGRRETTVQTVKDCLNYGIRCKKDGMSSWNQGNPQEALESWRLGDSCLARFKAPEEFPAENKAISELHCALLKNLSQAAMELGHWSEAIDAANRAIAINGEDHKAWFRKACALEGAGRLDEIEATLDKIDEIAVGRADIERIQKDTQARREKLASLRTAEETAQRTLFQKALAKGLFSEDRNTKAAAVGSQASGLAGSIGSAVAPAGSAARRDGSIAERILPAPAGGATKRIDDLRRKRVTRDGAEDLLHDLLRAYEDPGLQKQIEKLRIDMKNDRAEFVAHLGQVAFPVQRAVLEKWGFELSPDGVLEMSLALSDYTRGEHGDKRLRLIAEEVNKALYGKMYDSVHAKSAGLAVKMMPATSAEPPALSKQERQRREKETKWEELRQKRAAIPRGKRRMPMSVEVT